MPGPSLVGRDHELSVLTDLIGRVHERGGATVVLGEPGIGKSSLLRAAAEYGRQESLQVLVTTGIEAEAQLPFAGCTSCSGRCWARLASFRQRSKAHCPRLLAPATGSSQNRS